MTDDDFGRRFAHLRDTAQDRGLALYGEDGPDTTFALETPDKQVVFRTDRPCFQGLDDIDAWLIANEATA